MAAPTESKNEIDDLYSNYQNLLVSNTQNIPYSELNVIINLMLPFSQCQSPGMKLPADFITNLENVLERVLQETHITSDICQYLTNLFRLCRNVCATCVENQAQLHQASRLIDLTNSLLLKIATCDTKTDELVLLLRCGVQFIGNYLSGNTTNIREIWTKYPSVFRQCLEVEDTKLKEYVFMVIHLTISGCDNRKDLTHTENSWQLLNSCIQIAADSESENGLLVVEDCLKIPNFCEQVYYKLNLPARILFVEVLVNSLQRLPEDNNVSSDTLGTTDIPCVENIHYIAADFISQSRLVPDLKTGNVDENQILCTVKELECLCVASSHYKLYRSLQDIDQLVKTAVSLLQCIEDLGKQGNNVFTNVDKVSRAREVNTDHPVYGLKRDLIRLLGNMAHKHQDNQNLIRELDGIPLILDQTSIDGKNPFITQWSVFAIHNLTEENEDNRCYIANLKLEGVANNQAVLDEMGLQAVTEHDKVVIKKKRKE